MSKISDGPEPRGPEASTLALDMQCLLQDCVNSLEASGYYPRGTAEGLTRIYFFMLAIYVCNADGSVSMEEAALFRDTVGSPPTVPASSLPYASVGISNKMKCLWSYSQIGTGRGWSWILALITTVV